MYYNTFLDLIEIKKNRKKISINTSVNYNIIVLYNKI